LQLAVLLANLAANLAVLERGAGIGGVAAVTVATYALDAVIMLVYAFRLCGCRGGEIARYLAALLAAIAYCMLGTFALEQLLPLAGTLAAQALQTLARLAGFLLLALPAA